MEPSDARPRAAANERQDRVEGQRVPDGGIGRAAATGRWLAERRAGAPMEAPEEVLRTMRSDRDVELGLPDGD
jgi:hypothetical protein